jgi:hypothetical protein
VRCPETPPLPVPPFQTCVRFSRSRPNNGRRKRPQQFARIAVSNNATSSIIWEWDGFGAAADRTPSGNFGPGRNGLVTESRLMFTNAARHSFLRDEIADALIAAKNRGVTIRILADSSQANGTGSDIARLEAAGFQLKRTNGRGGGILHDKNAIIDGRLLVTGSYNWSTAFQTNFNSMWNSRLISEDDGRDRWICFAPT